MYGVKVGDAVVLTDAGIGKRIVETEPPSSVPTGYESRGVWVETADQLMYVYDVLPVEGTAQEASVRLARMQFMSLPDDAAYEVRALADPYVDGMTCYGEDNPDGMPVTRVLYGGELYRFIGQGVQAMQQGWNPVDAPSLWARILPGQEGSGEDVGEWVRPESTNGYQKGDRVTHDGHLWESNFDGANVWEPGAVGAPWTDLGVYPPKE